ncbi:hybrid sensor histidine kinase/response regulator [Bdellovibrio sp. ZAP7]|uniref:hybrid sensor histidine kinase/response regulator n=1 Tax=Bdellovibrio sp. ZAP7 TaxID=2231053 RepID=UPI00115BB9BE|nr:ATP-binding protein [Bdellovibrio sp. ZAP7]QDK44398.1 hybrid sensor histidine kinase/response regulator [Bdellovibrio sp. ZAP7]
MAKLSSFTLLSRKTNTESLDFKIRKLDLIYQEHLKGAFAILGNGLAFLWVAWDLVPHLILEIWMSAMVTTVTIRMISLWQWNKKKQAVTNRRALRFWEYLLYSQLLISGLGWGAVGVMAASTTDISLQILASLIIASMTAGPLIYYVSSKKAMACLTAPALIGWSFGYLLLSEVPHHHLLGILILFYLILLSFIGRNLNRAILRMISLDYQLKKNEEHLRMAMASSNALSWDWYVESNHLEYNGNIELFPEGLEQLQDILKKHFVTPGDLDTEIECLDQNLQSRHIAIKGKISKDPKTTYRMTGIAWDITTKKNEDLLRRERDVHEAANRGKSVLLANASHEIRTPIASILGYSETLLGSPALDKQNRQDVEAIHRQGKFMVTLVNDLLDLSKIESKGLYFQSCSMNPALELEDSVAMIRSTLDSSKHNLEINFETHFPAVISSDPVRFRQVVINLLSNAVKYTEQGNVKVQARFYSNIEGEGFISLMVSDTGMGMDYHVQRHLFEPFMRGENPEVQRVPGSGLGLALSRQLARGMGGDLRLVRSMLGDGSTFEFVLPVGKASELKMVSPHEARYGTREQILVPQETNHLKDREILVVDDSDDLRALMARYLMREGAIVETSENGQAGVDRALTKNFDVILMDIKMPVMDGYQAAALLREKGYVGLIVAVTAQATAEGRMDSRSNGFDAYLSKPVDINLLKDILIRA